MAKAFNLNLVIIITMKNYGQRAFARWYQCGRGCSSRSKEIGKEESFLISFRERGGTERWTRNKDGEPLQEVTAGRRDSNISNSSGGDGGSGGGGGGGDGSSAAVPLPSP